VVVAVVASLLVVAPPPAGSASTSWKAVLTFDKNQRHPFSSRLVWRLHQRRAGGAWKVVETRSWRAGSGMPGKAGRNPCVRSHGWLPNGTYGLRLKLDNPGRYIKGRAFRLDDKACPNGTVRRNLYLHTEQGAGNRQCRDARGDQSCRWEQPRINEYKSYGCIKVAPGDLAQLTRLFRRHFAAGVRHPVHRVALRVVG
jgi:hypothetical protein